MDNEIIDVEYPATTATPTATPTAAVKLKLPEYLFFNFFL